MPTTEYCLAWTSVCLSGSEWHDWAGLLIAALALPGVFFAAWKTLRELRHASDQREHELRLKRTEFTLAQHRRLFDDTMLLSVLRLLDNDDPQLADVAMFHAKRKFLVFFEELALLINAGYVNPQVAYYMFGYYADLALRGNHFRQGINFNPQHWGLFFCFVEDAQRYLATAATQDMRALRL